MTDVIIRILALFFFFAHSLFASSRLYQFTAKLLAIASFILYTLSIPVQKTEKGAKKWFLSIRKNA